MIGIIKTDINMLLVDLSWLKNKTILLTGATGLLGIYFLATLKKYQKELNITIYTWSRNQNPMFNELFENCNKIVSDITDENSFVGLPKFDCIIHASGYGQPGKFLNEKVKTIEINTSVVIRLLNLLNKDGKFLFISSSEIYSGLYKSGIKEEEIGTTNPFHPKSTYIEAKRCGETICNIYREMGYDVKIGRLSIAYGPGVQLGDTRVINSLINKGLTQNEIKLLDSGKSVRTFCYILDAIEMFWNILLNGKECVYNVGGLDTHSILETADIIGDYLMKKVVTSDDTTAGDPLFVNLSIDKYLKEFNKDYFYPFYQGILRTINWHRQLFNL